MKAFLLAAALLTVALAPALARSCRSEVGSDQASQYVNDCLEVTMATHPPCNAANPCDMILDEIHRNCDQGVESDVCSNYKDN